MSRKSVRLPVLPLTSTTPRVLPNAVSANAVLQQSFPIDAFDTLHN
jgi:hypothetical protein